jgi:hypothetical protein
MRKGARTVLCGGCRVTGIPTATGRLSSTKTLYLLFNGSQRWGWHPRRSSRLGLFRLVQMPGSHEVIFKNPGGLAEKLIEAGRD